MKKLMLLLGVAAAGCGEGLAPEPGTTGAEATPIAVRPFSRVEPAAVVQEIASAPQAATTGQRVQWVLGLMSCGFMEQARGEALVSGDAVQVPAPEGWARLYLRVGGVTCTDDDAFLEADVAADGTASLSQATPTYLGCWFFETP